MDEDDYDKFRLERVKHIQMACFESNSYRGELLVLRKVYSYSLLTSTCTSPSLISYNLLTFTCTSPSLNSYYLLTFNGSVQVLCKGLSQENII